jgi:hypothetical protein
MDAMLLVEYYYDLMVELIDIISLELMIFYLEKVIIP